MVCPTVQKGGTEINSDCIKRPALSSGKSSERSSTMRSVCGICSSTSWRSSSAISSSTKTASSLSSCCTVLTSVSVSTICKTSSRTASSSSANTSGSSASPTSFKNAVRKSEARTVMISAMSDSWRLSSSLSKAARSSARTNPLISS